MARGVSASVDRGSARSGARAKAAAAERAPVGRAGPRRSECAASVDERILRDGLGLPPAERARTQAVILEELQHDGAGWGAPPAPQVLEPPTPLDSNDQMPAEVGDNVVSIRYISAGTRSTVY